MENIIQIIQQQVVQGLKELYNQEISADRVTMNVTRKEFDGDYTVVVFPFTKIARKKPEAIGEELGQYLISKTPELVSYNIIKGFLNLEVSNEYWNQFLHQAITADAYGKQPSNGQKVLVEFSSPNTNKPLHLGHIRNILLGWSCTQILDYAGFETAKVQIINDRGIAICKSMLAWTIFANGATPESTETKPDHFVGKYYVMFETEFKKEYAAWQKTAVGKEIFEKNKKENQEQTDFFKSYKNNYFNKNSKLGASAKAMLLKWEANDPTVRTLWEKMNGWVYKGFEETYEKLGVNFDKLYYESNTYLLGKDVIEQGLKANVFYKKEDGSVWINLEDAKLGEKIVLRSDGTSVYITQDIGTAELRYKEFAADRMVYTVADEQNYHFQVLFEIAKRLKRPYANGLFHLSYGMVDLPSGKMKSREGTVVDADDLVSEVIYEAKENAKEHGQIAGLPEEEQQRIIKKLGLAALKYFIIKVNPKKRMTFDPKESVDMQGQTGPYIQNAYVRIQSVLRKAKGEELGKASDYKNMNTQEKDIIAQIFSFPVLIKQAADELDPSSIANYSYTLAKTYHRFYNDHSILRADSLDAKAFRLMMSEMVAKVLKTGMHLLGIEMPERM